MTLPLTRSTATGGTAARHDDFFSPQKTSADALPPPETFIRNIVRGVLEVLAGVREVEQLARWLSEEVYRSLSVRANLAARARSARRVAALRDVHEIRNVHLSQPADGVVEATVTAAARARTRAIALRLEGLDGRWRVTALALL
ncbi:3-hydroxyacyl-CoA dehydrogenase [Microbacterium sp. CFBP 8790]|uniref:Rv3235 family protein n=1 Tax=unclassified Microbacterium TaxID=2609290 RepID=UPI001785AC7F|nr:MULTISPECIES: Rv3235 family protein [unclassified Microbacterium]MBD8205459.1 3-hydroxyacyl-CoA dehydrogenase [Microbacterium sp. CFBP 8801]MBD8508206.1 3-hydroxyacyl-CoA dehydrogenase [Microbacterium sp. CFBP 8790]